MTFCPNCGKEISSDAKLCPNCGFDLSSHPIQVETAQIPATSVPMPPRGGLTSPRNLAYYSIICGVAAFLIFPIPLLILGLVLGMMAINKGEKRLGLFGVLLSIFGGVSGTFLGILFASGSL